MKKIINVLLIFISPILSFGQEYVTDYPYVSSTNCNYCRVAKIIVSQSQTKVLIEIAGQRGANPWVSFSRWTALLPYNSLININDLRNTDLEIPEPKSADPTYLSIWRQLAEKRKSMQEDALKVLGNSFIKSLGDNNLDTKYNIKSKDNQMFNFWLNFDKLPPGLENIMIIEFTENGFEWLGMKINNPDNTPKTGWNEMSLKMDWENKGISSIEGIYEQTTQQENSYKYRLAIKRDSLSDGLQLIYLSGAENSVWKVGDIKAYLSSTASPNMFKVKWYMANKFTSEDLYISFDKGLMKIFWTNGTPEEMYLKLYPTVDAEFSPSSSGPASGTGFAISEMGFIVTNQHVIQGAKSIMVKGVKGNFFKSYSAQLVIEDKNNDLAIIKINDPEFTTLGLPPYLIETKILDAGTSVYALGYPLRATMGDEVKLTNGIISSKTGFQGDITSYQISVPVQPGNSGGPLFDSKGNIIGVVNAKHTRAELVSYAIKANYLLNLIQGMNTPAILPSINSIAGKAMTDQVKFVKEFVYIIEVK